MGHEQKSCPASQASSLQEMRFSMNWWLGSKSSRKQTLLNVPTNWKFPERSLQKHQNTIPKFPSLRLIDDIVSGNSSRSADASSTQQLRELPSPSGSSAAVMLRTTLGRLPKATAPHQGRQQLRRSCWAT